jgi:hypothetical protein
MTSPDRPERSMPSQAWSTTAPTASSSFRQGITTEICGEAGGTVDKYAWHVAGLS